MYFNKEQIFFLNRQNFSGKLNKYRQENLLRSAWNWHCANVIRNKPGERFYSLTSFFTHSFFFVKIDSFPEQIILQQFDKFFSRFFNTEQIKRIVSNVIAGPARGINSGGA